MALPRRWLAAAAFGTLNFGLFVVGSGFLGTLLVFGAPWLGALLLALAIVGAHWALAAVDDLLRITPRDAAALVVRASMGGALIGAIGAAIALLPEGLLDALWAASFAAFLGLIAGLACGVVDMIALVLVGAVARARG